MLLILCSYWTNISKNKSLSLLSISVLGEEATQRTLERTGLFKLIQGVSRPEVELSLFPLGYRVNCLAPGISFPVWAEDQILTEDRRSKRTPVREENKTKTGSGQLRDFPWEGWETCPDIKRKRKKMGTSESSGSCLRCCETWFSGGASLMEAWWGTRTPRWEPEPWITSTPPWLMTRSFIASVLLLEG